MEDFRTRRLSLHQTVARDASPAEIVRTAAALDCAHVCLFVQSPFAHSPFPVVEDGDVPELLRLMDGLGVTLLSTTSFPLAPDMLVSDYAAALARAAALGASTANVRILDEDAARRTDNFGALAELARSNALELTIEFTGYGCTHAMDDALAMIGATGFGKLCLDPLHIVRTGTTIAQLRALPPEAIGYVQLCDGPLAATREEYASEGGYHRLPPGDGEFPLLEILAASPPGMPLALEVPQEARMLAGESVLERARTAVEGARRLLDRAAKEPIRR